MFATRWCAECAAETEFETFDCADHGAGCLELVCVSCGYGVEAAGAPVEVGVPARGAVDTAA